MTYTEGGLRDREYSKFATQTTHPGSISLVAVNNQVKMYEFDVTELVANAGGVVDIYSSEGLNGMLQAVSISESTFAGATGSLILSASGLETTMWSMVSGTIRGNGVATSGVTFPRATTVYTWSAPISGSSQETVLAEIPLADTVLHLIGSGLGNATSGLGVTIVYR